MDLITASAEGTIARVAMKLPVPGLNNWIVTPFGIRSGAGGALATNRKLYSVPHIRALAF